MKKAIALFLAVLTLTGRTATAQNEKPSTAPAIDPAVRDARIREIAATLPEHATGVGKPITDRAAWEALGKLDAYRNTVAEAAQIAGRAMPVLTDDLYLDYSRTGIRTKWEAVTFQRRRESNTLVLAECLENQGRFLPKIREYIDSICAEKTWVYAAHDTNLANFKGETIDIDLSAAELSWHLATARWLLGDRLPAETREEIAANVKRRVVDPFFAYATGQRKPFIWVNRTSNWNPVCHAGTVGATLATTDDRTIRATIIEAAERNVQFFIDAFGSDGYCSEGIGYWNYGFGHYVLLAEAVRNATGGKLDLMARPGIRKVALFGSRTQIIDSVWPSFADCGVGSQPASYILRYVNARYDLGLPGYEKLDVQGFYLFQHAIHGFVDLATLPKTVGDTLQNVAAHDSPLRTWFDQAGVLVARPAAGSACKIGVAFKGGHNAELHNHNDLGSFVVVTGGQPVLLDPGGEFYTARTFSPQRYESNLLNSFGHSVPKVAGKLQLTGRKAEARILKTEFTDDVDTIMMDLRSAYEVPELKRLERTFAYGRSRAGSFTVTDRVEFTTPQEFETALITLGEKKPAAGVDSPNDFVITTNGKSVRVHIDTKEEPVQVNSEVIHENAPLAPTRIGIHLTQQVIAATVTIAITPMD